MKKRAKIYLITLSCLSVVLFAALSLFWINRQALSSSRQMLEGYLSSATTLAQAPEDPEGFVRGLSQGLAGDIRITLLDLEGNVLGDSHASPQSMGNHLGREEVADAIRTGSGEASRASNTTGVSTLYVARLWNGEYVLRFAMPVAAAREFLNSVLPVLLVSLLILCILITSVVDRFSKRLAQPYESMLLYIEKMLQHGRTQEPFISEYEEMQPIIQYFNHLLDQISGHIHEITAKTGEIENIVGAMQEGLVLLDDELNILLINTQGSKYLSIPRDSWQRKITYLYRNDTLAQALAAAQAENARQVVDLEAGACIYRFYITPVPEGGFVLLISDVTEVVRLERMRSDFVANVTHELKTPLTSISGFAELMEAGMVTDPEKMKEYAGKIHTESLRLVRLIDDILKLSSVENAETPDRTVLRDAVDVEGVFAYVLELLSSQMKEKKLTAQIQGALKLRLPQEHLHELALNLCDNAVKYNREGGSILVRLGPHGFSVADTGIGISAEDRERIFERFYRADKARSRKTGGTGLGLAIAKHTAALYGGRISVESGEGGSVFTVVFPEYLAG